MLLSLFSRFWTRHPIAFCMLARDRQVQTCNANKKKNKPGEWVSERWTTTKLRKRVKPAILLCYLSFDKLLMRWCSHFILYTVYILIVHKHHTTREIRGSNKIICFYPTRVGKKQQQQQHWKRVFLQSSISIILCILNRREASTSCKISILIKKILFICIGRATTCWLLLLLSKEYKLSLMMTRVQAAWKGIKAPLLLC